MVFSVENAQPTQAPGIKALMLEAGTGFSARFLAGLLAPTDLPQVYRLNSRREPAVAIQRHRSRENFPFVLSTIIEN